MAAAAGADVEAASRAAWSALPTDEEASCPEGPRPHERQAVSPPRRVFWAAAAVLAGAVLLVVASAGARPGARTRRRLSPTAFQALAAATEVTDSCGRIEIGVDFASQAYTSKEAGVPSASACCAQCQADPSCGAWTWGMARGLKGLTDICFKKELVGGEKPPIRANLKVVSGLSPRRHAAESSPSQAQSTGTPAREYRSASLFCFSLVIPDSYEPALLRFQYAERASIFACEGRAVYSNRPVDIAPEVKTSLVDTNLTCNKGGEFGTALNLKIFLAVWTAVLRDAEFQFHGWTVKVDPDTVFFPRRLLGLLSNHHEPSGSGLYLNNCKYGLHGPMEVLSRKAVHAWAMGASDCVDHFAKVCSGDCYWGEDMFIDQCLSKVLHIRRENEFKLLTEDHCDAPPNWRWCRDRVQAAFHPFKTLEGWKGCMVNATS